MYLPVRVFCRKPQSHDVSSEAKPFWLAVLPAAHLQEAPFLLRLPCWSECGETWMLVWYVRAFSTYNCTWWLSVNFAKELASLWRERTLSFCLVPDAEQQEAAAFSSNAGLFQDCQLPGGRALSLPLTARSPVARWVPSTEQALHKHFGWLLQDIVPYFLANDRFRAGSLRVFPGFDIYRCWEREFLCSTAKVRVRS